MDSFPFPSAGPFTETKARTSTCWRVYSNRMTLSYSMQSACFSSRYWSQPSWKSNGLNLSDWGEQEHLCYRRAFFFVVSIIRQKRNDNLNLFLYFTFPQRARFWSLCWIGDGAPTTFPSSRGKVNLNNSSDFQVSSGSLFTPGKLFQHAKKDKIRRIEDIKTLSLTLR